MSSQATKHINQSFYEAIKQKETYQELPDPAYSTLRTLWDKWIPNWYQIDWNQYHTQIELQNRYDKRQHHRQKEDVIE